MRKLYVVKDSKEFEKIIKNGKVVKNKSYVIYHMNNNLPYNRYVISVGKKIGNAVHRNKYKRRIRAIIDNSKKDYINSQDYIIILRGSAKDKDYQSLEKDFLTLISNIRKEKTNESTKEKK